LNAAAEKIRRCEPFERMFGDPPAMTDQDIRHIIAFMKTLSDGYKD
jgi:cytochrome c peroxidase